MEFYKMDWGDVLRMNTDFRFPVNSIEHIEFAPLKKKYEKFGNRSALQQSLIYSFRASIKKFSCRKWVLDEVGKLPSYIENTKQKRTRWNVEFIKIEEAIEDEEEVEEIQEEEIEEQDDANHSDFALISFEETLEIEE